MKLELSDQTIFAGVISLLVVAVGWVIKLINDKINSTRIDITTCQTQIMTELTELNTKVDHQSEQVNELRLEVVSDYVHKDRFERFEDKLMVRFDKLEDLFERRNESR